MRKGKFTAEQDAHLNTYIPELLQKLGAGVRGVELTRWKQSVATKALGTSAFADLDVSTIPRTEWFKMIVRKYTNYFNNVYRKSHPEEPPTSTLIKNNPLLKFTSILNGRQLFARDFHDEIGAIAAQRVADTGINAAAAHQIALKEMWDALSAEEKSDWDSQAEDEAADVESNQKEFSTNIHLALRSLCQGGLLGDAEMVLFYGFRDTKNGDLLAGTVHGHSKHNKTHFGGDDLAQTYGIAWSKFAESAIPRPAVSTLTSVTVNEDGTVNFPSVDLDNTPVANIRVLLEDYLEKCWIHRILGTSSELPIPWEDICAEPGKFYDDQKFVFPTPLKNPQTMNTVETLILGEFFNSICPSEPFHFVEEIMTAVLPPTPPPPPPHRRLHIISTFLLHPRRTPTPSTQPPSNLKVKIQRDPKAIQDKTRNQESEKEKEGENKRQRLRKDTAGTDSAPVPDPPVRRSSRTAAPKPETSAKRVGLNLVTMMVNHRNGFDIAVFGDCFNIVCIHVKQV
ncbi:hypothetical protein B0H13DRAFT_1874430 [Mycena leptocephala]|nr:hypothetical protein B0H13DRAFT_1874430 [Mycena leptocephala]